MDILREAAIKVLSDTRPMTVRQVYYRLVAAQLIDNDRGQYKAVSELLVKMRQDELIPWEWMEDRTRQPRQVSMWSDLDDFVQAVRTSYRRDVWTDQPSVVEVWLEKDALSGIFEDALRHYGVTLNVGRGYDGWDSIHNAAERWESGDDVTVLYFGDFDPSGEDMARSLVKRLSFFNCKPEIIKCALTNDDVTRYNLPPDFTKHTDSRRAAFVERWGDISVELDALPPAVLRERLVREVEARMDLHALALTRKVEAEERARLTALLDKSDR